MKSSANPFHYDVMAASLGKCPVCGDGVGGCPRCFMMPTTPDGTPLRVEDFAYDPILEASRAAAEKARKDEYEANIIARKKNQEKLLASGLLTRDDVEADSDDETDSKIQKYRKEDEDEANKIEKVSIKVYKRYKGYIRVILAISLYWRCVS